jgi:methanogenic corrinoid protein MtbC1
MDALRENGLYGKVKVIIGGPPITDDFAREIGADFRGRDAYEGVEQAKPLVPSYFIFVERPT